MSNVGNGLVTRWSSSTRNKEGVRRLVYKG